MKYVVYGRTIPSLDRPASDPLIHMCSPDLERTWLLFKAPATTAKDTLASWSIIRVSLFVYISIPLF